MYTLLQVKCPNLQLATFQVPPKIYQYPIGMWLYDIMCRASFKTGLKYWELADSIGILLTINDHYLKFLPL